MKSISHWRKLSFAMAVACLVFSIATLLIGARQARRTDDYLAQAKLAIPFIRIGTPLSLASTILSLFGTGKLRVA